MSQIILVRHGETVMNTRTHLVGGRSNHTPLTPRGEMQAGLFGLWLGRRSGIEPDIVLHSGSERTRQTGLVALTHAGIDKPLQVDQRLQELSQGKFEGYAREKVYTPEMIEYLDAAGLDGHLPTGESLREVQDRMSQALFEAHRRLPDGTVLIFGHGLSIRALVGRVKGLTKKQILNLKTDNVSVTKITIDPEHSWPHVNYVGRNVIKE